ncbi:MAG TPA: DUF4926 domain-containing protein [Tepidisphaeraceae bacterium]
MRSPHVDDEVRLVHDIPELSLSRGEIGVVRSTWFAPTVAYEVEFHKVGLNYQTRALLLKEQLTLAESAATVSSPTKEYAAEFSIPYAG